MEPKQPFKPLTIRFVSGPLSGGEFQVEQPVTTIGRDATNDVVIASDLHISRRHARLLWAGARWRIENVSQTASVRVNDEETRGAALVDGAVVTLGETTSFIVTLAYLFNWRQARHDHSLKEAPPI